MRKRCSGRPRDRAGGRAVRAGKMVVAGAALTSETERRAMFFYPLQAFWFFAPAAEPGDYPPAFVAGAGGSSAAVGSAPPRWSAACSSWRSPPGPRSAPAHLNPLEERFRGRRPAGACRRHIVLGGGLRARSILRAAATRLNSGGDRFVEAAVLARRFPEARVSSPAASAPSSWRGRATPRRRRGCSTRSASRPSG